jgi:hypothetical protein
MQRISQLLMVSLLVLGSFKGVQAASYYVDSASGSDANSGTSSGAPWKSLSKVNATTFQPGDTVNFKAGLSWDGGLTVKSNGTVSAPVIYQTYGTGSKPVFRNSGGGIYGSAITITGDYNILDGVLARDSGSAGILIRASADHNVVRNSEVTASGFGVEAAGQYNLITKNYVHDLKMIVNDSSSSNDYGAVCFWLSGPNNEISYNKGVNCRAPSYDFGYDGGFVEVWSQGDNSYVHHNWAENTNGFFELGAGGSGSAQNVKVAYNVIYNAPGSPGLCFNTGSYSINTTGFKFENNTYVQVGSGGHQIFGCSSNFSSLTARNNIFYSNIRMGSTPGVHTNNLYYMIGGASIGYSLGAGEKTGDPGFVSLSNKDLHLQSGSPAIDAGASLGYTKDYDDKTVPVGPAPDMGAHEYGGATPTLFPPSNLRVVNN